MSDQASAPAAEASGKHWGGGTGPGGAQTPGCQRRRAGAWLGGAWRPPCDAAAPACFVAALAAHVGPRDCVRWVLGVWLVQAGQPAAGSHAASLLPLPPTLRLLSLPPPPHPLPFPLASSRVS